MRRLVLISGAGAMVLAGTAGCVVVPADDYYYGHDDRSPSYGHYTYGGVPAWRYHHGGEGGERGGRHHHRRHGHHHSHDDGGERGYDD